MPQTAHFWTPDEVRALPADGRRYEVDLEARLVERWRPGDERPEVLTERLEWIPQEGLEPLVIDLPEFFARVFDDAP